MQKNAFRGASAAALLVGVMACGDGTGPNSSGQVGLGFRAAASSAAAFGEVATNARSNGETPSGVAPSSVSAADGLHLTRDNDEIVLTRAQLVVRDVKLKLASATCSDDDDFRNGNFVDIMVGGVFVGPAAKDGDTQEEHDCPTVRIGPYLVDVMLLGTGTPQMMVVLPEGTYSSVRFSLHKVTSNSGDDAVFRQANPDFRDISARLEGTYNGVPFTFVTDVNAKVNVPLMQPLVVGPGGADLTVAIDFGTWFVRPQGGLYSPALANTPGSTRASVQNNIRVAFRAFRDRNHDGHED